MRLAVVFLSTHGQYMIKALSKWFEVIGIDISDASIPLWSKYLSAIISFHFDRHLWRNDYYRSPVMLWQRQQHADKIIKKKAVNVDAILQLRAMFPLDYSLFGNAKLFVYTDSVYNPRNRNWLSPRWGKYFSRMQMGIYQRTEMIFTHSRWAYNKHIELLGLPPNKMKICGWGPALEMATTPPKGLGYVRNFIFIGGEVFTKGFDILLKAFDCVSAKYPYIFLHVVGLPDNCRKLCINSRIIFHGRKYGVQLISLLRNADVLVLPSRFETSGRVTIEAMSYGVPVIVTNVYGAPEPIISGNCGLVIQRESVPGLIAAMETLINDPKLYRTLSTRAFYEAHQNWTWDAVCSRMATEIIRCCTKEPKTPPKK